LKSNNNDSTTHTTMTVLIDKNNLEESAASDSSTLSQTDEESTDVSTDPVAIAPQSAGVLLSQARAAAGIHIATLSMALKVPVKKLEALEADDWTTLPDPVFVRALATSVCRQLKTDSAPILAQLPKTLNPFLKDDAAVKGLNQRFIAATDPKASLWRFPVSVPMLLGALVLLLASLILMFLPDMVQRTAAKKTEVVEVATVMPPALPPAPSIEEVIYPPSTAPIATTSSPVPLATASAPSVAASSAISSSPNSAALQVKSATPAIVLPTPTPTPTPTASAPAPALPASSQPTLRMVAKGVVWVEVKDAKGTLLVHRTLQPKEVVTASGLPPLAVVVGRINEMQSIDVRGKPFSLTGLSPDNVARFEVK
jgi:cytoskeleton protein RodZ